MDPGFRDASDMPHAAHDTAYFNRVPAPRSRNCGELPNRAGSGSSRRFRAILLAGALANAAACTTVEVSPVPSRGYPIEQLCIERNPDVVIEDFLAVVERGVARSGIDARVVDAPSEAGCDYTLWYAARRRWDIRPVLGYAELRVRYRGETIGEATYLSRPSLSPFKWRSTESKIGPIVDELLAQFARPAKTPAP